MSKNLNVYGRELVFDRHGLVAAGDGNTPDFSELALANLAAEADEATELPWQRELRRRWENTAQDTELSLSATEWEEIPSPATEVEEESDEDAPVGDTENTIFTSTPVVEREDVYARLAEAVRRVENHALVKKYGFSPDSLITDVGGDHPVAMGFETLRFTLAACQAADELATLAGHLEVNKVLGWTGNTPPALGNLGADRLFHNTGALQARIAEILEEREAAARKVGGIRPRLTRTTPSTPRPQETNMVTSARIISRPAPSAPAPHPTPRQEPMASGRALVARITAGQDAAVRLASPGAADLLRRALATRNEIQATRLVADAERMLRACEDAPLPKPRPSMTPRPARPPAPAVRAPGKTARKRVKEQVRREEAARLAAANPTPKPVPAPKADVTTKKGDKNGKGKGGKKGDKGKK